MNYRIKRGDEEFGPYSLADLQHHVQTGHVSPQDLAQSEGMNDWVPVAQVLGDIPVPTPMTFEAGQHHSSRPRADPPAPQSALAGIVGQLPLLGSRDRISGFRLRDCLESHPGQLGP